MASLSPILSGESSPTNAGSTTMGAQEARRLMLARSQCRTPSTSSQLSELDEEMEEEEGEDDILGRRRHQQQRHSSYNQQRMSVASTASTAPSSATSATSATNLPDNALSERTKLTSGGNGNPTTATTTTKTTTTATSIAKQFLMNREYKHTSVGGKGKIDWNSLIGDGQREAVGGKTRLKHIIQSIPIPLIATTIITVLIVCLLLSKSKSPLQVATAQDTSVVAGQSPLAMTAEVVAGDHGRPGLREQRSPEALVAGVDQQNEQRRFKLPQRDGNSGSDGEPLAAIIEPGDGGDGYFEHELAHHAHRQQHEQLNQRAGDAELDLSQQQLALRRGIIGELMKQHHSNQNGNLRSSLQPSGYSSQQQHHQNRAAKRHSSEPVGSSYESLGSLIGAAAIGANGDQLRPMGDEMNGGAATGAGEPVEAFVEGVDEAPAASARVVGPSLLRSSALELDASDGDQVVATNQNQQHHRQHPKHQSSHHKTSEEYTKNHQERQQQQQQRQIHQQQLLIQQQQQQFQNQHQDLLINDHNRPFDVPIIQCNNTEEGFERFACPTPDELGRYRCIEDRLFCDGYYDCPKGEDENKISCMYYKLFVSHIDILTNTFLTWMKKQNRQSAHGFDVGVV